jgi:hypothetical protein
LNFNKIRPLTLSNTVTPPQVSAAEQVGIKELITTIKDLLPMPPKRTDAGPFVLSFDHCFQIRGQGTILTGTILSGGVKPGAMVDLPAIGEPGKSKKVRSLQMWRQSVQSAMQGDRVALCVPQLKDTGNVERGLLVRSGEKENTNNNKGGGGGGNKNMGNNNKANNNKSNSKNNSKNSIGDPSMGLSPAGPIVSRVHSIIAVVEKLDYFQFAITSKAKFHLTVGHETVMAKAIFFCPQALAGGGASGGAAAKGKNNNPMNCNTPTPNALTNDSLSDNQNLSSMGTGALVASKKELWPTGFDRYRTYVGLNEAFSSRDTVTFVNAENDTIELHVCETPGYLEFFVNDTFIKHVSRLTYVRGKNNYLLVLLST